MSMTAEQVVGARALFDLAENVRQERGRWKNRTIRAEIQWTAEQLEAAGRIALTSSATFAEAWHEAGTKQLSKFIGARKMIENIS